MINKDRKKLALNIIRYDSYLNWALGVIFLVNPGLFLSLLAPSLHLPYFFWIALGVGFLLFAAWQTFFILKPADFTACQLQTAAVLAWLPVLALTYLLFLLPSVFYPNTFIVLWLANLYMLLLGGWYLYLSFSL